MKLKIDRPVMFFDLETTGTSVTHDRIVEISMLRLDPGADEPREWTVRLNPGMHIPEEATAVHHITDEDVACCPRFTDLASKIAQAFAGCDIAGFNSTKFDLPLLCEEMARACVNFDITSARLIDVQNIFHKKEKRTLSAAYRFYCDKDLEGAHSANADTRATYEVLLAQLERYDDLPVDSEGLAKFSAMNDSVDLMGRFVRDSAGNIVFNFGKYKGQKVEDVLRKSPSYYTWMIEGDFPVNTKAVLSSIYNRMRMERK
ncbi:MAG: 3'-5' exonuclease [Muribaculaceae bacterium]|jgi:DNA polymerase III, epsilon subunit and related 3''-5'' exonucleases|nr:3'-5' exonuclease [Muribaculaceae bacterium]